MIERRACAEWPRIFNPAPGCMPPVAEMRRDERVLHVALRSANDMQDGLARALASIASLYRVVDPRGMSADSNLLMEASQMCPTLIWMQLQAPGVVQPATIRQLRQICPSNLVVINWDGDQHYEPYRVEREWFRDLGKECDASLVVNTRHPPIYAELGVKHPGFLGVGTDHLVWAPVEVPEPDPQQVPEVVFLANNWTQYPAYEQRHAFARQTADLLPGRFAIYGAGWQGSTYPHRPYLQNYEEGYVYSAAKAALSISIRNDLPRYTSNRLFYALSSGAVVLMEKFPDYEGLGVEHGVNAIVWEGWEELRRWLLEIVAEPRSAPRWQAMRAAARELGCLHSWDAHMPELLAIVDAIRLERRSMQ